MMERKRCPAFEKLIYLARFFLAGRFHKLLTASTHVKLLRVAAGTNG